MNWDQILKWKCQEKSGGWFKNKRSVIGNPVSENESSSLGLQDRLVTTAMVNQQRTGKRLSTITAINYIDI